MISAVPQGSWYAKIVGVNRYGTLPLPIPSILHSMWKMQGSSRYRATCGRVQVTCRGRSISGRYIILGIILVHDMMTFNSNRSRLIIMPPFPSVQRLSTSALATRNQGSHRM